MHWDWFAIAVLGLATYAFLEVRQKLISIVELLEVANRQQASYGQTIATKLDGVIHYAGIIRERMSQ